MHSSIFECKVMIMQVSSKREREKKKYSTIPLYQMSKEDARCKKKN